MLEVLCLTVAIYYEARGEPIEGQAAVAQVILNRVQHPDFPDDACAVVFEPNQFSFVADVGIENLLPVMLERADAAAIARTSQVALEVVEGYHTHITSTHYHATYVEPFWADEYTLDFQIGDHIFYSCMPEERNC
jgi:spore germination cell wall hydrolase CwlJ-like protein